MLAGSDGFELCRLLRAAGVWAPVLMLTARVDIGYRVGGLDAGADDYLVKPFSLLELAAALTWTPGIGAKLAAGRPLASWDTR